VTESVENQPVQNQAAQSTAAQSQLADIIRTSLAQELASFEARENAVQSAKLHDRPRGRSAGVFSVRLDPTELAMLEARAAAAGIGPSVLARNLIRMGLTTTSTGNLAVAIERVETAVAKLRATVG
jgi:hypothetical protein